LEEGPVKIMNGRERILESFKFRDPDRPFRWECVAFWRETKERWEKEGLKEDPNIYFEFDKQISFLGFNAEIPVNAGFTSNPYVPALETVVVSEDETQRVIRDGNGILRREFKQGAGVSMPQWLEYPVKKTEDYEDLKNRLDPLDPRRFPPDWNEYRERFEDRDFPISMGICGFFGHLRNLVGPEKVSIFMYREPDFIREALDHWTNFNKVIVGKVKEQIDPDYMIVWEDMCFKTGPLVSPSLFEEFLLPCYKDLCSHLKGIGIENIAVDTDGNVDALLPLFIEGGINGMVPFEVLAGNDILKIREENPKLWMLGGLNKKALTRDKALIDRELDSKVPQMLESGGYVPSLDHAAPPDIPLENFAYYIKRVREIEARYSRA
jgi:uroporphyrinogen decarboxylase